MKYLLLILLFFPFLVFGQVKNKPKTQKKPKEPPHEELRKALYEGKYKDALKYIAQGADILKTDTLERVWTRKEVDKNKTILKKRDETPRVGAFIGMILPPVAVLEGQARGQKYYIDDYHIVDVALERTLADSIKSPERLKVIEYLLQKGAKPNGGFENYPLFVAVRSKDLQAVELLFRYKADANITFKHFINEYYVPDASYEVLYPEYVYTQSVFNEVLNAYSLGFFRSNVSIKEKKLDSSCRKEFWQMTHLLLKNGLNAGKNISNTIYDDELFDYFLSIADKKDIEQSYIPVFEWAYRHYNIEVVKKLKAKGFVYEGEKDILIDIISVSSVISGGSKNPEFMKTLNYLLEIGIDPNIKKIVRSRDGRFPETKILLCEAIGIRDLELIKKLLSLGAKPYTNCSELDKYDGEVYEYFREQVYIDYEQNYILTQPKEKQKALKKELKEIIKYNKQYNKNTGTY